ncbi:uncharacterized protein [Halyomorpha halys]|uniref:uncharacterized protein isoform X2 n=1 Tax=Halyomorpha halys TaxID=286706 RepID=UPI0006D5023A|nr:uncharacterized protein LOC106685614 isoform X2 [Halyomorpha halys]
MSMGHQIQPVKDVDENDVPWSSLSDSSSGSCGSSSSFSWTDETDQSSARELEEQFQKFEEALYLESNPNELPQSLQDEFKIWAEYAPHIRIRGIQAKLNKRTENEGLEDIYDVNYEEVLALHNSLESPDKNIPLASDNSNNDISPTAQIDTVNKLFDENWPIIQERIEPIVKPVSACQSKADVKMLERCKTNPKTASSQKILSRSNSSRSYLRDSSPRKANLDHGSEYSCPFSSRGVILHNDNCSIGHLSGRESCRVPRTSVRKVRINRISTFSAKIPENSNFNRNSGVASSFPSSSIDGSQQYYPSAIEISQNFVGYSIFKNTGIYRTFSPMGPGN